MPLVKPQRHDKTDDAAVGIAHALEEVFRYFFKAWRGQ